MAEAFLTSDLAQGLLCNLFSLAAEPVIRAWRLQDDLNSLKERMRLVQALLSFAEGREVSMAEPVRLWIGKLSDVARDADVLLDELAYEVVRQKVENQKVPNYFSRLKTARKIKNINLSLGGIYRAGEEIGLRPLEHVSSVVVENRTVRHTPPSVDDSRVVGREGDKLKLIEMLCNSNDEKDLTVVAIEGMGGMGKTTLAQVVYKNTQVVKHFGERMWITVSEDFDAIRILNEMVQSLSSTNLQLSNLEALVKKLKEELDGKKFLLVLDDVWNENQGKWDDMQSCLLGISSFKGSKILITTRRHEVSRIMQSSATYPLLGLSEGDSWDIFRQRAFPAGGAMGAEKLEAIGKRMVKRCGGVPLAIKALGGLLYGRTEREWLSIEANACWDSTEVLPSLRMSFNHLQSSSLKHCFAYCSIFPKGYEIRKDCLLQQWMALGLLHHSKGSDLDDIGENCFNILLRNSLLQDVKKDEYDNVVSCKMHDLVHDLAVDVSKNRCLSLDVSKVNDVLIESVHVKLVGANKEKWPKFHDGSFKRLQTLYLKGDFPTDMLKKLKHLRILVLVGWNFKELPRLIGKLKHLRYIDISETSITTLPDSITNLFLLQTLRMYRLTELPKMFGNLINLEHFYLKSFLDSTNCLLTGIRQLALLRTLQFFVVNRAKGCQLEELGGLHNLTSTLRIYNLGDVRDMEEARKANLHKKSNIQALEFYWEREHNKIMDATPEDTDQFKIMDATPEDTDQFNDEEVLEGLEPHPSLQRLKIENFKGKSFASWMMTGQSLVVLHNLVEVKLLGCKRCEKIPTLGHLPYLRVVEIKGMSNVRCIDPGFYGWRNSNNSNVVRSSGTAGINILFPALRKLSLRNMQELEEWLEDIGVSHSSSPSNSIQVFPCLEELDIFDCPKLKMIPRYFPSLKTLSIWDIDDSVALEKMSRNLTSLTMLKLGRVGGAKFQFVLEELFGNNRSLREICLHHCNQRTSLRPDCLQFCTSLETLRIWNCSAFVSVPELRRLTRLTYLDIGPLCRELDYFPWSNPYSSLQVLCLYGWPKLKSLPEQLQYILASSLTDLHIRSFDGLISLPDWLANLSNLQTLSVEICKNLQNMPSVETMLSLCKLKVLHIHQCPLLQERCTEGGSEWYKIAHVPQIQINGYRYMFGIHGVRKIYLN